MLDDLEPEVVAALRTRALLAKPCRITPGHKNDVTGQPDEPDGCATHGGYAFGPICEAKLRATRKEA